MKTYEVIITFYDEIPVRYGVLMRRAIERGAKIYSETTPDIDNRAKRVIDDLAEKGFFSNDRLVARLVVEKVYALKSREPKIIVNDLTV